RYIITIMDTLARTTTADMLRWWLLLLRSMAMRRTRRLFHPPWPRLLPRLLHQLCRGHTTTASRAFASVTAAQAWRSALDSRKRQDARSGGRWAVSSGGRWSEQE